MKNGKSGQNIFLQCSIYIDFHSTQHSEKKFLIFVWNKCCTQIRKTLQSEWKPNLPDVKDTSSLTTAMVQQIVHLLQHLPSIFSHTL